MLVSNAEHAALVGRRFAGRVLPRTVPVPPNVPPQPLDPGAAADVRDRLRLPADAPLLVFFGFVHPVKGLPHLLAAVAPRRRGADPDRPAPHLVVAGGSSSAVLPDGEAAAVLQDLRQEAARPGVADAVTWTGYLPAAEASRLLAAADVVVLPFTRGATTKSGALAAAHAHGAPVVATVADPPDPALVGDRDAVLVPPGNPAALAAAVRRVLPDAALAQRLRESGRRSAEPRSWPRVAAEHAALYRALGLQPAAEAAR